MGRIRNGIMRFMGVDRLVNEAIEERTAWNLPTAPKQEQGLLTYRQKEYALWAKSNPDSLFTFYKTQGEMQNLMVNRMPFWRWIGNKSDLAKIHHPAPESLLNHMKSMLFSGEVLISVEEDNKDLEQELNDKIELIEEENDMYNLLQTSSYLETYSGTLGYKFVIDTDVSEAPIMIPYPAERIKFTEKYGRALEVIFEDYYTVKKDTYTLHSVYGYGYITYRLYNHKGKQVPLTALPETSELRDVAFTDRDGKPIKVLMASWKQNRTHSNEFPDLLYGGSDFEGIIDNFHTIDEIASTKVDYLRKTRSIIAYNKGSLPQGKHDGVARIPQTWENDSFVMDGRMDADDLKKMIYRDTPEINLDGYDRAMMEEYKAIYQKIGMAYSSAGLESVQANVSSEALDTMEKATIVLRDNKIKLWQSFLKRTMRLALIYQSLIDDGIKNDEDVDKAITYVVSDTHDYNIEVEFPDYNNQSFNERLEENIKAYNAGLVDLRTAITNIYIELDEEQIDTMVLKIKQEQGNTILEDDLQGSVTVDVVEQVADEVMIGEVVEEEVE